MKSILIINTGSSSLKFAFAVGPQIVLRGQIERFGPRAQLTVNQGHRREVRHLPMYQYATAFRAIQLLLTKLELMPTRIVHRFVHGGERFAQPIRLTPPAIRYLRSIVDLAPVHLPANLLGLQQAQRTWSTAPQWAVFDTAIYQHLPVVARTYAIDRQVAERYHIRKFGFHGFSHDWAAHQAARLLHQPWPIRSLVTIHLGSGASMTLWRHGRPIDTSMGLTPLEGLVMSTRSGDIDPAIPLYLQRHLGWSVARVETLLNQRSGLLGLSGLRDMRDVLSAVGHPIPDWPRRSWSAAERRQAGLALEVYIYRLRRTLAGYLGLIDRPQAIVFTGPIGENRDIQRLVLEHLPPARAVRRLTVHADEEQAIVNALRRVVH